MTLAESHFCCLHSRQTVLERPRKGSVGAYPSKVLGDPALKAVVRQVQVAQALQPVRHADKGKRCFSTGTPVARIPGITTTRPPSTRTDAHSLFLIPPPPLLPPLHPPAELRRERAGELVVAQAE
jgi:hypothetical protein